MTKTMQARRSEPKLAACAALFFCATVAMTSGIVLVTIVNAQGCPDAATMSQIQSYCSQAPPTVDDPTGAAARQRCISERVAQICGGPGSGAPSAITPFAGEFETPIAGESGIRTAVANIVKWLYTMFFIVAILFILLAAYNFIAGAGDENRLKKAKDQLKYAVIAIVVALVASGVSIVIKSFLSPTA